MSTFFFDNWVEFRLHARFRSLKKNFPGRGWVGVGVVGLAENKANSAQLELELGLSLAKMDRKVSK